MTLLWVGSAPGVRLFDGEESTAWAGVYQVDWLIRGFGAVLTLWRDKHLRVLGTNRELSEWMVETFIAPMSRAAMLGGVSWGSVAHETAPIEVKIDLDTGAKVRAGDIDLELAEPLDRQLIHRDAYALEGATYRVSFVNVSCGEGGITVGGSPLPGRPRLWADDQGRLRSSAQLAVAEAWST